MNESAHNTSETSTLRQRWSELFSGFDRTEAISRACQYLAHLKRQTLSEAQLLSCVQVLAGLPVSALVTAFERAEADYTGMPEASVLKQLAGFRQQQQSGMPSKHADEAWQFIGNYVYLHGIDGHARMTTTEPGCYKQVPAPEIPKHIRGALSLLGNGVRGGLLRFASTKPADMGFLRKDFDAAYARQFESAALELVTR